MAPGPNNVLAFATSAEAGFRHTLLGGTGRLVAFAGMIAITAAGLGVLLLTSELAFTAVKIAGALYLVYVGWRLWTAPPPMATAPGARDLGTQFRREFWIAAGNPKAIAIFTAFFPQFIDRDAPAAAQFAAMGAAFLVLEALALALYAAAGRVARGVLDRPARLRLLNRGTGAFLMASGASLAASGR